MKIAKVTNFRPAQNVPTLMNRLPARRWMVQSMSQILADIKAKKPKINVRVHQSSYGQTADTLGD
jgi:hypothetical protein